MSDGDSKSISLYKELLEITSPDLQVFTKNYPRHPTQFQFNEINEKCVEKIYGELRKENKILPRLELVEQIDGLGETCSPCWKFYMTPRNRSAKFLDIKLGKEFEKHFVTFLNHKGIPSDTIKKGTPLNYPDVEIFNEQKTVIARCEIKYMSAPFLMLYKKKPGRECYEGSNTLDVGEKIQKQRKFVETEINEPVFYVYWLDYPCVKGVFFMESADVYHYIDSVGGEEFERKERTGDFVKTKDGTKKKLAQTRKVYLPLYSMKNFDGLMQELNSLVNVK